MRIANLDVVLIGSGVTSANLSALLKCLDLALSPQAYDCTAELAQEASQGIASWTSLLIEGRGEIPVAATRMEGGTDINFGDIARKLIEWLIPRHEEDWADPKNADRFRQVSENTEVNMYG